MSMTPMYRVLPLFAAVSACDDEQEPADHTGTPGDADTDADADADTDADSDSDADTDADTDTGQPPNLLAVEVVWTANRPRSRLEVHVDDPTGNTTWNFGMAETQAGSAGWFGEDCFVGSGPYVGCHPIAGDSLVLDEVDSPLDVAGGATTLLWSGMELTYYLDDGAGRCWTWGHDPSYYAPLGCSPIPAADVRWDRRALCSGLDPADPAPLGGRVALTFDDGPHPTITPQILSVLRARNVPATFFMLGEMVADPAAWPIVTDIAGDPLFEIANHSWDHADLASLDDAAVDDEIDDTDALLATFGVTPQFFRFPYGSSSCRTADTVRDAGYLVAGWHIDTADWCYASGGGTCDQTDYWRIPTGYESDFLGFTLDQIDDYDGGVVLLHDIHQFTADQLDTLIGTLSSRGYTFVPLSDATAFPLLNANTPYDFPFMGEPCDTAADRCWEVEYNSWCEPTGDPAQPATAGVCVVPCEDFCIDRDGVAPLFCAETASGEGHCLSQSLAINDTCAGVPGTVSTLLPLFDAGSSSAEVCLPYAW